MTIRQPQNIKVRFFASHSWTHSHRRDGLHAILQPWVRGFDFQDYSISRAHPLNTDTDPQLARELRDIIVHMDALLIMAGMYANNSSWMQFEIDMAFAFDVPIIPILANGQTRIPRLPTRLATIEPVRWRGDSIREALLRCISTERRQVLEAQVAHRVAAAEAERRRRADLAARHVQHYTPLFLSSINEQPTSTLNALSDYFDPLAPSPTNYLAELLRRR